MLSVSSVFSCSTSLHDFTSEPRGQVRDFSLPVAHRRCPPTFSRRKCVQVRCSRLCKKAVTRPDAPTDPGSRSPAQLHASKTARLRARLPSLPVPRLVAGFARRRSPSLNLQPIQDQARQRRFMPRRPRACAPGYMWRKAASASAAPSGASKVARRRFYISFADSRSCP